MYMNNEQFIPGKLNVWYNAFFKLIGYERILQNAAMPKAQAETRTKLHGLNSSGLKTSASYSQKNNTNSDFQLKCLSIKHFLVLIKHNNTVYWYFYFCWSNIIEHDCESLGRSNV